MARPRARSAAEKLSATRWAFPSSTQARHRTSATAVAASGAPRLSARSRACSAMRTISVGFSVRRAQLCWSRASKRGISRGFGTSGNASTLVPEHAARAAGRFPLPSSRARASTPAKTRSITRSYSASCWAESAGSGGGARPSSAAKWGAKAARQGTQPRMRCATMAWARSGGVRFQAKPSSSAGVGWSFTRDLLSSTSKQRKGLDSTPAGLAGATRPFRVRIPSCRPDPPCSPSPRFRSAAEA